MSSGTAGGGGGDGCAAAGGVEVGGAATVARDAGGKAGTLPPRHTGRVDAAEDESDGGTLATGAIVAAGGTGPGADETGGEAGGDAGADAAGGTAAPGAALSGSPRFRT
jgi:hypothetical protein